MTRIIFFAVVIFFWGSFFLPIPASALNKCEGAVFSGLAGSLIDNEEKCRAQCTNKSRPFGEYSSGGFENVTNRGLTCCCLRAAAVASCPAGLTCLDNPLDTADIPTLIGKALRGLLVIIGTIALVIFIYGGALWMTAFGEESKVKRGWDTMIWGSIGLVVIFGSYVAVDFILKAILGS